MSIIRISHNKENPFLQINKQALQNPRLSLKATGLWARCMSRPDDWIFRISHLVKSCKEGRTSIYSAIDELIAENYAMKLEFWEKDESGKFKGGRIEYIFFEFPASQEEKDRALEEFKKSFRHSGFRNTRNGDTRNEPLQIQSDIEIDKKRDVGASPQTPSPSVFSPEIRKLTKLLVDSIKESNPKAKIPENLSGWHKKIDQMIRLDQRPLEEVEQILIRLPSCWWADKILSPDKLRKHYAILWADLIKISEKPIKKTPFQTLKEVFKNGQTYNGAECALTEQGICFMRGTRSGDIKFDKFFSWKRVEELCESFGITIKKEN